MGVGDGMDMTGVDMDTWLVVCQKLTVMGGEGIGHQQK